MFKEDKFRELILHIASKSERDKFFSATKLNKILFYSDFLAYKTLGEAITDAEYFALEHGPAPRLLKPTQTDMMRVGDIALERRTQQHRTLALRPANLDSFSAAEIAIVDLVIDALRDMDAETVSLVSHGFLGWKAAWTEGQVTGEHVTIPYDTVFVSNPSLDEFEEAHGLELAERHGWLSQCSA